MQWMMDEIDFVLNTLQFHYADTFVSNLDQYNHNESVESRAR